jgi:LPS export ABC transporter protein LptC
MRNSLIVRRLLGALILVAVTALVIIVARYFINNLHRDRKAALRSAAVEVALKKIHFTESSDAARKWELFAESGEYDKATDRSTLKDIRFVLERTGKGGPVTVTARRGEYAHASKNVELQGDVFARTEDGMTFATPSVSYQASSRTMRGSDRVKLDDGSLTVEGNGFDLDIDRREARIHSNVTATIYPDKRKK